MEYSGDWTATDLRLAQDGRDGDTTAIYDGDAMVTVSPHCINSPDHRLNHNQPCRNGLLHSLPEGLNFFTRISSRAQEYQAREDIKPLMLRLGTMNQLAHSHVNSSTVVSFPNLQNTHTGQYIHVRHARYWLGWPPRPNFRAIAAVSTLYPPCQPRPQIIPLSPMSLTLGTGRQTSFTSRGWIIAITTLL